MILKISYIFFLSSRICPNFNGKWKYNACCYVNMPAKIITMEDNAAHTQFALLLVLVSWRQKSKRSDDVFFRCKRMGWRSGLLYKTIRLISFSLIICNTAKVIFQKCLLFETKQQTHQIEKLLNRYNFSEGLISFRTTPIFILTFVLW